MTPPDPKPPTIPGFARHGNRYRIAVSLERAVAQEVADEAAEREINPGRVMEERIVAGRRKRKS